MRAPLNINICIISATFQNCVFVENKLLKLLKRSMLFSFSFNVYSTFSLHFVVTDPYIQSVFIFFSPRTSLSTWKQI